MSKAEDSAEQTRSETTPVSAAAGPMGEESASDRIMGLLTAARRCAGIATVLLARSRSPLYRPETRAAFAAAACDYTARAERACREVLDLLPKPEEIPGGTADHAVSGGSRTSWELLATLEAATRIGAEVDRERNGGAAAGEGDAPLPGDGWARAVGALAARLREEMDHPHPS